MTRARAAFPWLVVAGVLVVALSMRSPIVAPTPVMRDIAADFGIDAGTAGLITTAPILMFSLITPLAALLIRRSGAEIALMTTAIGVLIGSFVRTLPGFGWLIAGMLIIGAAITIGNVVVPVIIRRDVPAERVSLVTAAYTATLNVGSLITSLATAPLAALLGWPLALLVWSVLAVVGVLVWGSHMRKRHMIQHDALVSPATDAVSVLTGPTPIVPTTPAQSSVWRPITFMLMIAFGLQSASYYALTTWLPTIAADTGGHDAAAAGALASLFQGVAIAGAFLVPVLQRVAPPIVTTVVVGGAWIATTVGLAAAPQLLMLWVCIGAVAQAGGFVVIFATLARVAKSDAEAAGMSAVVQGGGYLISAMGAPIAGLLHDATGAWTSALWMLAGATTLYTVILSIATLTIGRRHAT